MTLLQRSAFFLAFVLACAFPHDTRAATRDIVAFSGFAAGPIVVKTGERRLYFVIDSYRALRFPVGVGRAGMTWSGTARVEGKYVRPAWAPPDMIRRENPRLPAVIPGGGSQQSDGRGSADLARRRICHPRYQPARLDRRLRLAWMYSHVQQRYPRALSAGQRRHACRGRAITRYLRLPTTSGSIPRKRNPGITKAVCG